MKQKMKTVILVFGMLMSLPFCGFAADVVKAEVLKSGKTAGDFFRPNGERVRIKGEIAKIQGGQWAEVVNYYMPRDEDTDGVYDEYFGDTGAEVIVPKRWQGWQLLRTDNKLESLRKAFRLHEAVVLYGSEGKVKGKEVGFAISKGERAIDMAKGVVHIPNDSKGYGFGAMKNFGNYVARQPSYFREVVNFNADGSMDLDFSKATLTKE